MTIRVTAQLYHPLLNGTTGGFGPAAGFVRKKTLESESQLLRAEYYFPLAKDVLPVLESLDAEAGRPESDGKITETVGTSTPRYARAFVLALPAGTPEPSVGAEPDGRITFTWSRFLQWEISVSVGPGGELRYSALLGPSKARGTELLTSGAPLIVLGLIRRLYSDLE